MSWVRPPNVPLDMMAACLLPLPDVMNAVLPVAPLNPILSLRSPGCTGTTVSTCVPSILARQPVTKSASSS